MDQDDQDSGSYSAPDGVDVPLGEDSSDYAVTLADSAFCSLTSSVNAHIYDRGRRYHIFRNGRYPLPNDHLEEAREGLRHDMMKELLRGRLFLAPIGDNPQKIIDLGTGFGQWATEIGDHFPSASVVGVDLSPIQPDWVPPNVRFIVDDIEDEWVHDADFDYVHLRVVASLLKGPEKVIANAFRNTKPGGWIEFQEILPAVASDDGTFGEDHPIARFYNRLEAALRSFDIDMYCVARLPALLEEAGYTNITRRIFKCPIGDWPKDSRLKIVGTYFREVFRDLLPAVARPFGDVGFSRAETECLIEECRCSLSDASIHAYMPIHFVWGQRPAG